MQEVEIRGKSWARTLAVNENDLEDESRWLMFG